jgi:alanine racemase
MLYGSSPFADRSAQSLGLLPVMTLKSRLIAINTLSAGDAVGYGGTFVADRPMRIGVVSIGYGDGYPRKAPTDTPVLVETPAGMQRTTLKGRVSMDMITIDVTDLQVEVGASVVLWGDGLPADEIAQHCATIAYELFCQVTARVPRQSS